MRTVCFVVNSRANYARIKTAIRESISHPNLEVQIVVGASGLLYRFGNVSEIIERDGFRITERIYTVVEGDEPVSMAKTTGLSILSLADAFQRLKPDVVVTVADRYETIATAIAASYMNIPVAHTQGGEVTGSIDDNVRHAITKLSHLHFPATQNASSVLSRLGEDKTSIFCVGCPSIDLAYEAPHEEIHLVMNKYSGVGSEIDFHKPYLLVSQHPDTLEYQESRDQISATLQAIQELQIQAIWLWPNVDSGSDAISKKLREFREVEKSSRIRFYRNFEPVDYINVLRNSQCIVGNSSSGIREASFLGKPSVNVGLRQRGREKMKNVIDVPYDPGSISRAIQKQIDAGGFEPDYTYGRGDAGKRIAEILATNTLSIKKQVINFNDFQ